MKQSTRLLSLFLSLVLVMGLVFITPVETDAATVSISGSSSLNIGQKTYLTANVNLKDDEAVVAYTWTSNEPYSVQIVSGASSKTCCVQAVKDTVSKRGAIIQCVVHYNKYWMDGAYVVTQYETMDSIYVQVNSSSVTPTQQPTSSPGYDTGTVDGSTANYRTYRMGSELLILEYKGNANTVYIPEAFGSYPPNAISGDLATQKGAFQSNYNVKTVYLSKSINRINTNAFVNSGLTNIIAPTGTKLDYISIDSFKGCPWYNNMPKGMVYMGTFLAKYNGSSTKKLIVKNGTERINDYAFESNCGQVNKITLPSTITSLSKSTFSRLPGNVTIEGYKGSVAETFANQNGYKFVALSTKAPYPSDAKKANTMTIKAKKTLTVKKAKVKKAKQALKAFTVKNAKGKVVYKKISGSKKLSVQSTKGKIVIKKGTKKGTYKIKVKITAKGNSAYKAKSINKTVTVKVK
ncbi:MAG: leucine-rich repeat protein [Ruminococcus sp.]|nr:leucine-rich repeat protein [Ruminococcus sp.]